MTNRNTEPSPRQSNDHERRSPAPPADMTENTAAGIHARSHAAHLDEGPAEPHPKPAGDLRQGLNPGTRKQP